MGENSGVMGELWVRTQLDGLAAATQELVGPFSLAVALYMVAEVRLTHAP